MEKFGAISTPVSGASASSSRSRPRRAASNPVVPTTESMPCSMHQVRLPITASGWVKSTTTSGLASTSASRSSPTSSAATSSQSSAASTAWQVCEPILPLAPSTATRIVMRPRMSEGEAGVVVEGAHYRQRRGSGVQVGGERGDVVEGHHVDPPQDLVHRRQLAVHELCLGDPGHLRPGVLQPHHHRAAQLALAAQQLVGGDPVARHRGQLVADHVEHLGGLLRQPAYTPTMPASANADPNENTEYASPRFSRTSWNSRDDIPPPTIPCSTPAAYRRSSLRTMPGIPSTRCACSISRWCTATPLAVPAAFPE